MSWTPSRAQLEMRLTAIRRSRDLWKGDPGYCTFLNTDIYALQLALEVYDERREALETDGGAQPPRDRAPAAGAGPVTADVPADANLDPGDDGSAGENP